VALNIKNETVERLAAEVARRHGVTKTEAARRALEAELERSSASSATARTACDRRQQRDHRGPAP